MRIRSRHSLFLLAAVAAVAAGASARVGFTDAAPSAVSSGDKAPAALVGTWKRNVTTADIARVGGAASYVSPGPWRLRIAKTGSVALYNTPSGTAIAAGSVKPTKPGTLTVRFVDRGSGECTDLGTYGWRRSGSMLVLARKRDPCNGRLAIFVGRWGKA